MNTNLRGIWRRGFRRLGPIGVAAAALGLGAIPLAGWALRLHSQGNAQRATVETKTDLMEKQVPVATVRRMPVGQQIEEFVGTFPSLSQNSEDLKEVFLSAKRHQVPLPRGEYQLKNEANAPLLAFTATFPLNASYGSTKDFTAEVLRKLPHAAMDELRMTRSAAGSAELESSVRFTLIYRRL